MNIAKRFIIFIFSVSVAACGGGGGGDGGTTATSTATSQSCAGINGLEAIYWDFVNGIPRGDLPTTAFTIPFPIVVPSYSDPRNIAFGMVYPQGWTATPANDITTLGIAPTIAGADLVRADNQAIWRYLSGQLTGGFTAKGVMDAEVSNMLANIGNPSPITVVCEVNEQVFDPIGNFTSAASTMIRAGNFTAVVTVRIIIVDPPGVNFSVNSVSVGPTAEFDSLIANIFIPMFTQFYGGGSSDFACNDSQDNDGDTLIDFPQDPGCTSEVDDDETG